MHSAPSVSYPVGRSRFAAGLLAALWLAGGAVLLAWSLQPVALGWRQALAWVLLLAAGAWALAAWWRSPEGLLAWDGAGWHWQPVAGGTEPGLPAAALDLQARLLLRWRAEQGPLRWLWAERDAAPADWDALRRAVYSPASETPPAAAAPPPAER